MKFMCLADLHENKKKWQQLVGEVEKQNPDIVVVAGDLIPKEDGILNQLSLFPEFKRHASSIRETGAELVLILGNDDNRLLISEMEKGEEEGLWHYTVDRVKKIKGYEFCGCPWVPDYPFPYKYWVAPESKDNLAISGFQLDQPIRINDDNQIEIINNLEEYLAAKPSIQEVLDELAAEVQDLSNSIWLIHGPPANLALDVCGSGDRVGSQAVYQFLLDKQPLLSVHGHIHEAPAHNGNIWASKVGKTTCIQPGQLDEELYYVTFELEDGQIKHLNHSIYGMFQ